MDAVTNTEPKFKVFCPECNLEMKQGAAFPCSLTGKYTTIEVIKDHCKVMGKPWEPIEEPEQLDLFNQQVAAEIARQEANKPTFFDAPVDENFWMDLRPKAPASGGSASYYKLPEGATELQDLIEHKNMSFAQGNIFKAMYRLGEKDAATVEYDLEKTIWFAFRELNKLRKLYGRPPLPMPEWLHP